MSGEREPSRAQGSYREIFHNLTLSRRWTPIVYGAVRFEEGFRADIIVEGKVILELKSTEQPCKVHPKQVLTYLKLKGLKLGFVLNFGSNLMKEGIERVVNGMPEENLGLFASLRGTQ